MRCYSVTLDLLQDDHKIDSQGVWESRLFLVGFWDQGFSVPEDFPGGPGVTDKLTVLFPRSLGSPGGLNQLQPSITKVI